MASVAHLPVTAVPKRPAYRIVRRRNVGQWTIAVVIVILALLLLDSIFTNPNYKWNVVASYFFSPRILVGLGNTLLLTVIAMVLGILVGFVAVAMRRSSNPVIHGTSVAFLWFFRGIPVYVQLIFWGFLGILYPVIGIGVPSLHFMFFSITTKVVLTPWIAAILGLSLHEGAHMAEVIRSGLDSVPKGQVEAAKSIGMTKWQTFRRIVLPPALLVMIPPTGNNVISMLKTTSIVSILAFPDLLYAAQIIYTENFLIIPLLITASIWYLIVTSILMIFQGRLESLLARSTRRA